MATAAASTAAQLNPPARIACTPPFVSRAEPIIEKPEIQWHCAPLCRLFDGPRMTAHKAGDPTTLNRLYGRSSGHKLRPSQQQLIDTLLPEIAVPAEDEITAQRLFGDARPLHLEIGF